MNYSYLFFLCVFLSLTGCATSTLNYYEPPVGDIQNTVQINEDFEIVWDRLVKNLASDFFVINNIEKNSKIINVSFSSNNPENFVTCGNTFRTFKNARGEANYNYDPAQSTNYTMTDNNGMVFHCRRNAKLNGRVNIYVSPNDKGTLVNVNSKYILDVSLNFVNVYNQPSGNQNFSADFSTKSTYSNSEIICRAKGIIESKILQYALK